MGSCRDLSIRSKIMAAIATVIFALLAVGVLAIVEMSKMNDNATDILRGPLGADRSDLEHSPFVLTHFL
jgi:hypothetical protein